MEIGIALIKTENIKTNLEKLSKSWKDMFATNLNSRARMELQTLTTYINEIND